MKPARPKRTRLRAAAKKKPSQLSKADAKIVQEKMAYNFNDMSWLHRAMTHLSAVSGDDALRQANQRLEFLGDRVLALVVADRLMTRRPNEREGALAPRLNMYVRKEACANAMRHLELGDHIIMSAREIEDGGRTRDNTLGDACEALIGAIYRDSGLSQARKFIERAWAPQFANGPVDTKDPKTRLQEWAQARALPIPKYTLVTQTGPDHSPDFVMRVDVSGEGSAKGEGSSKQTAERAAAIAFLKDKLEL